MLLNRISATVVGLALLAGTVVVPALAQQEVIPTPAQEEAIPSEPIQEQEEVTPDPALEEVTPDPDSNAAEPDLAISEEEEAQRELSASEEDIQQLVNEGIIEAPPNENEPEASDNPEATTQRERALLEAEKSLGHGENPRGSNCNEYSRYFGKGCQAWCADFVSWAFDWQGNKDKKLRWQNPSAVASILAWAEKDKHLVTSPQRADIFILKNSSASHTGFVRTVNAQAGTFTTVEGNTSTYDVKSVTRKINGGYKFARFPS